MDERTVVVGNCAPGKNLEQGVVSGMLGLVGALELLDRRRGQQFGKDVRVGGRSRLCNYVCSCAGRCGRLG